MQKWHHLGYTPC